MVSFSSKARGGKKLCLKKPSVESLAQLLETPLSERSRGSRRQPENNPVAYLCIVEFQLSLLILLAPGMKNLRIGI